MSASVILAQVATTANEHEGLPSKWVIGGVTLVLLLAALFVVTRFNADR